jgi:DNA modification methylase
VMYGGWASTASFVGTR